MIKTTPISVSNPGADPLAEALETFDLAKKVNLDGMVDKYSRVGIISKLTLGLSAGAVAYATLPMVMDLAQQAGLHNNMASLVVGGTVLAATTIAAINSISNMASNWAESVKASRSELVYGGVIRRAINGHLKYLESFDGERKGPALSEVEQAQELDQQKLNALMAVKLGRDKVDEKFPKSHAAIPADTWKLAASLPLAPLLIMREGDSGDGGFAIFAGMGLAVVGVAAVGVLPLGAALVATASVVALGAALVTKKVDSALDQKLADIDAKMDRPIRDRVWDLYETIQARATGPIANLLETRRRGALEAEELRQQAALAALEKAENDRRDAMTPEQREVVDQARAFKEAIDSRRRMADEGGQRRRMGDENRQRPAPVKPTPRDLKW